MDIAKHLPHPIGVSIDYLTASLDDDISDDLDKAAH